jgi:CMP-N-acetylneuraminic acid synthetase
VRIATICARKGSKGLPGKNLAKIDGKSLVALATLQAVESSFTALVVREARPVI